MVWVRCKIKSATYCLSIQSCAQPPVLLLARACQRRCRCSTRTQSHWTQPFRSFLCHPCLASRPPASGALSSRSPRSFPACRIEAICWDKSPAPEWGEWGAQKASFPWRIWCAALSRQCRPTRASPCLACLAWPSRSFLSQPPTALARPSLSLVRSHWRCPPSPLLTSPPLPPFCSFLQLPNFILVQKLFLGLFDFQPHFLCTTTARTHTLSFGSSRRRQGRLLRASCLSFYLPCI